MTTCPLGVSTLRASLMPTLLSEGNPGEGRGLSQEVECPREVVAEADPWRAASGGNLVHDPLEIRKSWLESGDIRLQYRTLVRKRSLNFP